jgi:hypothetical protein
MKTGTAKMFLLERKMKDSMLENLEMHQLYWWDYLV